MNYHSNIKRIKINYKEKSQQITAVLQDCEICSKITFIFRKKYYLSRKYAVPKFATSQSRGTLVAILKTTEEAVEPLAKIIEILKGIKYYEIKNILNAVEHIIEKNKNSNCL